MAADDEEAKDVEVVISLILYIQVSISEKIEFEKGVKPDVAFGGAIQPAAGFPSARNRLPSR